MTETLTHPPRTSLYDRLGGRDAVAAAVDALYTRLLADPQTATFFTGVDLRRLNGHMRMFLTAASGGGPAWTGRDLGPAHAHLGITDADFDRVAGQLAAVLTDLGVVPTTAQEVLALVGTLRPMIVSVA